MGYLQFTRVLLVAFTALFPVVNPIGCAAIFLSMTQRYPQPVREVLARKIAVYSFVILAVSLVFGTPILNFFGISLAVIQIAGGLVVGATGWKMLNAAEGPSGDSPAPATMEDALGNAFFPLTLPITVGPGSIAIAITLGADLKHETGPGLFGGVPRLFIAALLGMCLVCVLVLICYGRADRLVRALGRSGTSILVRLSAFVLFAIGVQIFWNGLIAGIPEILEIAGRR
jgi:multiple antibiotic resistance protein